MPTELTESTNYKELIGSDVKDFLSAEQTWYSYLAISQIQ